MTELERSFAGKVVVVTGGSRGIGLGIATGFAKLNADVVICSKNAVSVEKAAKELEALGYRNVMPKVLDIRFVREIEAFFDEVAQAYGRVDILINNAGVQNSMPASEVGEDVWDAIVDTNLKGTFFCSRYAAAKMPEGGCIVNISSVQATYIAAGQSVYSSTKAAIVQLTRCLAKEWAADGIRVNCVAPGSVLTDINRKFYEDPKNLKATLQRIPLGRQGRIDEIAEVVTFLASDASSYITGQTLFVDGGWLLA